MVLNFKSVDKSLCVAIQNKVIEQYFRVVQFIMLHKVVLPLMSVEYTLLHVTIQKRAIEQDFYT